MKPILTKEEKEKRERRRIQAIGIIMLLIMVLSTFGYAIIFYSGNKNSQNENNDNELTNLEESFLTYSKNQTRDIPVNVEKKLSDYKGKIFYVAGAGENEKREITKVLYGKVDTIMPACYGSCEYDLPEKNCSEQILVFKNGSSERVYQEDECVFVEGGLKALDAFLYYLIG